MKSLGKFWNKGNGYATSIHGVQDKFIAQCLHWSREVAHFSDSVSFSKGVPVPIFLTIRIKFPVNLGTLLLSRLVLHVQQSINGLMCSLVNMASSRKMCS